MKGEYYRQFENGTKTTEYRLYGPRWNERTCRIGRAVVLSLGYGKRERLKGIIRGFIADPLPCLDSYVWRELKSLYPNIGDFQKIACIEIEVIR